MKHLTTVSYSVFFIVFSVLNHSVSAEITSAISPKPLGLMSRPVTNESVEAGLREIREARRASPEFQTNLEPVRAAQDDSEQLIQSAQPILPVLFRRE